MKEISKKQLFGSKVRNLREEQNYSQEKVANLLNIDMSRLEKIENSEILDLNVEEVILFAKLFKQDVPALVKATEQEELQATCSKLERNLTKAEIEEIKSKYLN
jgi:transcriptional regulator with XRE-family HTH domain